MDDGELADCALEVFALEIGSYEISSVGLGDVVVLDVENEDVASVVGVGGWAQEFYVVEDVPVPIKDSQ